MPPAAAEFGSHLRLHTGSEFSAVFDRRQRTHGKYFALHIAANNLPHARLGLAVSRRVSKKAVDRNRIKRQIRESFRQQANRLGDIDYVVVAKPVAAQQCNAELRKELETLWTRANKKHH